ncbi:uncharacterized protein (UPF0332 family) [Anaerobacterium chartisolvens]|uniref:Uncharacterized protein (UPF0332 family) n=1 Tax=Anaerobacterium chartisolvens TaxID=1297424 RepID=A0A369BHV5_9FIRM|nr:HEPN domain-containing protein [Anaerobacterium chartisolvens]RCX20991.1 uncharacterized protein (UPF0332 family) [Anaerobacterium chartisolvens]
MFNDNVIYLAKHRLSTAEEDLETAIDLLNMQRYKGATNRAYYAIFHSMRAVLALEGADFKKHSGVIAFFRQNFIKTGEFDIVFSEIIQKASFIRNESDYSDFYIASREEAEEQVEGAKRFFKEVLRYLKSKPEWTKEADSL